MKKVLKQRKKIKIEYTNKLNLRKYLMKFTINTAKSGNLNMK